MERFSYPLFIPKSKLIGLLQIKSLTGLAGMVMERPCWRHQVRFDSVQRFSGRQSPALAVTIRVVIGPRW